MVEAAMLCSLAALLALGIVELVMPWINDLMGRTVGWAGEGAAGAWLLWLAVVLVTIMLIGSYPALGHSALKPAAVVRGGHWSVGSKRYLRRLMVTLQFGIASTAVICAIVVAQQQRFLDQSDLGYNPEGLIYVRLDSNSRQHFDAIKAQLLLRHDVIEVTAGSMPIEARTSTTRWDWEGKDPGVEARVHPMWIEPGYVDALKLELTAGQNFLEVGINHDYEPLIVNETAVRIMGYSDPIGKRATYAGHYSSGREGRIVGVVKDFHYGSMHHQIGATVLLANPEIARYLCVRARSQAEPVVLKELEAILRRISPTAQIEPKLLDETIREFYGSEFNLGSIVTVFAGVVILVSCLGLVGMAAHAAESRRKENAIRKAVGASALRVALTSVQEISLIVLVALTCSVPIAHILAARWLDRFAYHISVEPWIYILTGVITSAIALSAVSYQTWRAATLNPTDVLRCE
jgi:hypothetical protein